MPYLPISALSLLCLVNAAHAQSYSLQFSEGDTERKIVLCAPVLEKVQDKLVMDLLASVRQGGNVNDGKVLAVNVGYRAEVFAIMAEQISPSLLREATNAVAELVESSRVTKSKWTGLCIDLYNHLRKEKKINLAVEKFAKTIVKERIANRTRIESPPKEFD
jgi:hypothetical protein